MRVSFYFFLIPVILFLLYVKLECNKGDGEGKDEV